MKIFHFHLGYGVCNCGDKWLAIGAKNLMVYNLGVDLKDIYGTPIIIPKGMSKSQTFNVKVILTKEPKEEGIYSLQIIEQTT